MLTSNNSDANRKVSVARVIFSNVKDNEDLLELMYELNSFISKSIYIDSFDSVLNNLHDINEELLDDHEPSGKSKNDKITRFKDIKIIPIEKAQTELHDD